MKSQVKSATRKSTPTTEVKTRQTGSKTRDPDDKETIKAGEEPKCPFKRGDPVESVYSGVHYTVESVKGYSLVRVVTSTGEALECIMTAADLKKSGHKARNIGDD